MGKLVSKDCYFLVQRDQDPKGTVQTVVTQICSNIQQISAKTKQQIDFGYLTLQWSEFLQF